ncbi:MAG: hypothetical protein WCO00_18330 [Rhodospirillaceae bacterium]
MTALDDRIMRMFLVLIALLLALPAVVPLYRRTCQVAGIEKLVIAQGCMNSNYSRISRRR